MNRKTNGGSFFILGDLIYKWTFGIPNLRLFRKGWGRRFPLSAELTADILSVFITKVTL